MLLAAAALSGWAACADPEAPDVADRARFATALRDRECGAVRTPSLRDDCWLAAVAHDGGAACERIGAERRRGECWFRAAERAGDPALCPRAAPFDEDCALHVLSASFPKWVPAGARPGEGEPEVERRIAASGLQPGDPRPWSAYYRWVLGAMRPLDRAACAGASTAPRREACVHTGLALYGDLLNHARDRGTYPCDGGELPASLRYTPDPDLDALRAARTDLCAGPHPAPGPRAGAPGP